MKITENITLDFRHDIKAGKTACIITKNDIQQIGLAKCSSKDQFSRPLGRKHSLIRVLSKEVNGKRVFDRVDRTKIWSVMREKNINLAI